MRMRAGTCAKSSPSELRRTLSTPRQSPQKGRHQPATTYLVNLRSLSHELQSNVTGLSFCDTP